ncbi:MAG: response regulator [Sphingobacteriaceae bacterium]|nr:response regulator [Sphingobacteriaceae bacterium]
MAERILVVEDERMMLKVIEFRLKKDGFDVLIAEDGKAGIEAIKNWHPDVIITDIMMPYISGLELIAYTRNDLQLKVPIIVLSAVGLEKTVVEAFGLGADDFITKPFSAEELSIRVKKNLLRR